MTDEQFETIKQLYPNLLEYRHWHSDFQRIFFVDKSISIHPLSTHNKSDLDGFEISLSTDADDGISINLDLGKREGFIIVPEEFIMSLQTMGKLYENEVDICHITGRNMVVYYDRKVIMRKNTIANIIESIIS